VIVLAAMLIAGIVALMNSIPLSIRTIYSASRYYTGITPRGNDALTPILRQDILKNSPVPIARTAVIRASEVQAKSIVGPWPFIVLALKPDDLKYSLTRIPHSGVTGRLPQAGKPEVVLSAPVAKNIGKKVGDVLLRPDDPKAYSPMEVKIVGIIQSDVWVAYGDYDYYSAVHFPPIDLLMVWAKTVEDQDRLSPWAYEHFKGQNVRVYGHFLIDLETNQMFAILYKILNVVIFLLVVVITLMMGMLISIHQTQRIPEFGLLQALGFTKKKLLGRVMAETFLVVMGGWMLGVLAAWLMLSTINAILMAPNAFMLDVLDPMAYLYTLPVPVAILVVAGATILISFRKFDPIAIVERRLI
jgi:ABC-type lipoprotein release transport system permease subunit